MYSGYILFTFGVKIKTKKQKQKDKDKKDKENEFILVQNMHSGYLSFANGCNCHPDDIFPFILKTTAIFTSPFTKKQTIKKIKTMTKTMTKTKTKKTIGATKFG